MSICDMDKDVEVAANEIAGNWKKFESFGWRNRPEKNEDDYAIVYLSNRDSGCLGKSNEAAILKSLAKADPKHRTWHTESHGHWAVGHVDGVVIRVRCRGKVTKAFKALHECAMALANYPVLDESDFSERETEEADRVWSNCYSTKDRIEYIRDNREQFEFRCFSDMLACARGKFFAGYASELIG